MTDESAATLPAAVTKAYDLLLWLINHVGKFPRSHRFVLGDRIESRMLTVLKSLVLAAYSRGGEGAFAQGSYRCPGLTTAVGPRLPHATSTVSQ